LAEKAKTLNMSEDEEDEGEEDSDAEEREENEEEDDQADGESFEEGGEDEGTRILTVEELEDLFLLHAPDNFGKF
jgi:large subunit GTPase 1